MSYLNVLSPQGVLLGVVPRSLPDVGQAAEMRSLAGERSAAIAAGTEWTVPAYVVGGAQLEVYLDGVACMAGEGGQYAETGEAGASSGKIVWSIDIPTDADILVRSK